MHGQDTKTHPSTLGWIVSLSIVATILFAINLTAPPEPPGQALSQAQPPFASTLPFRRATVVPESRSW